jgi:hypothetical protein
MTKHPTLKFSALRKKFRAIPSYAVILFLIGCAAAGPMFSDSRFANEPAPEDKARLIVFRDSHINLGSVAIGIDGTVVGALAQSGFIVADIDPGDRKITASPGYIPIGNSALAVNVKAGEVCYIKISQRIERTVYPLLGPLGVAFWFVDPQGEFRIETQAAAAARKELSEMKLSE